MSVKAVQYLAVIERVREILAFILLEDPLTTIVEALRLTLTRSYQVRRTVGQIQKYFLPTPRPLNHFATPFEPSPHTLIFTYSCPLNYLLTPY